MDFKEDIKFENIVSDLISKKKEGSYWDFKECFQDNNADLVHDIICLANNPNHNGYRYIIYGVNDAYKVVGMSEGKKQSDIIDTLRNVAFSNGTFPSIELKKICIENKDIVVLVIEDCMKKPYFLTKTYRDKKSYVQCSVYSREGDTNTPRDKSASISDIELMWKQRWGLDLSPYERLSHYLSDKDGWEIHEDGDNTIYHYIKHPEFTIKTSVESYLEPGSGDVWTRAAINPNAWYGSLECKYQQTVLFKRDFFWYDEMRKKCPQPEVSTGPFGALIYFFVKGSFEYNVLKFFDGCHHLLISRVTEIPIIVFSSDDEKSKFLEWLVTEPNNIDNIPDQSFLNINFDSDQRQLRASIWAYEKYNVWIKEINPNVST